MINIFIDNQIDNCVCLANMINELAKHFGEGEVSAKVYFDSDYPEINKPKTAYIGKTKSLKNIKLFNNSCWSIAICQSGMMAESSYADCNIQSLPIFDLAYVVLTLVFARFNDTRSSAAVEEIKTLLAKHYSFSGDWKAHADVKWNAITLSNGLTAYEVVKDFWEKLCAMALIK